MSVKITQTSPIQIIINDKVADKIDGKWIISETLSQEELEALCAHLKAVNPTIDSRKNNEYWREQSTYNER